MIISRIAPTPSGYLHLGNIANFILNWALVKREAGHLHLRIDDIYYSRTRDKYIEDILSTLDWLRIDIDEGPSSVRDFHDNFSQRKRFPEYLRHIKQLDNVYACDCSRKKILEDSFNGLYPGTCRSKGLPFIEGKTALRIVVPENTTTRFANREIELNKTMGDFVLVRKGEGPSYQIASVVDDESLGINLIVRGEDLLESTAAQVFLAGKLGLKNFLSCRFVFHPLMKENSNTTNKLSKSHQSLSIKAMREGGVTRQEIYQRVAEFFNPQAKPITEIENFLDFEFYL